MSLLFFRQPQLYGLVCCRDAIRSDQELAAHTVFDQYAGAFALQTVLQRAVGINVFLTHQTLVGAGDCIQTAAAALDGSASEDDTERHAYHNECQEDKSQNESTHFALLGGHQIGKSIAMDSNIRAFGARRTLGNKEHCQI